MICSITNDLQHKAFLFQMRWQAVYMYGIDYLTFAAFFAVGGGKATENVKDNAGGYFVDLF